MTNLIEIGQRLLRSDDCDLEDPDTQLIHGFLHFFFFFFYIKISDKIYFLSSSSLKSQFFLLIFLFYEENRTNEYLSSFEYFFTFETDGIEIERVESREKVRNSSFQIVPDAGVSPLSEIGRASKWRDEIPLSS